ncbi:MAG: tRNA lysidine(34) synthetase TilS, partial [Spirochaetaceae bacterium]|nr:tRNA lysidine(34) synthetase TilS [Spirochaetaceae bacterium]
GSGIEAAAREARRRALRRTALRCHADAILIAHTKNDLLENIIIRVLRGAGPAGLSPIQAKNGIIIRPLLNLTRGAILDYLDARGLTHQTDSTNNDDRHLRNKVRRHIIPILDQRFPDWAQNLQRAAETQRLVASHLKDQAQEIISGAQHRPDGALVIPNLSSHHRIVQEETIFCAINSLQQRAEPAFQPDQRQRKIAAPRRATIRKAIETRKTTQLPGGTLAFTDGGAVISPTKSPNFEEGYALLAERDGVPTVITHEGG